MLAVVALAVACAVLVWDDVRLRRAPAPKCEEHAATPKLPPRVAQAPAVIRAYLPGTVDAPPTDARLMLDFFRPQPGEDVLAYRDRVLPVVKQVLAPQRDRVARARDTFATEARLDESQRRAVDDAVRDAGEGLKDRIMQAVLSGELDPDKVKPATGVAFARDLLQLADGANRRVRGALRPDQIARLDASDFDVIDYLVFRVRWEDLLGDVAP